MDIKANNKVVNNNIVLVVNETGNLISSVLPTNYNLGVTYECSNDLNREETNIINRWMESEPLKKFIFRLQNEDIETNKIKKKIFRNPDIIFDLIVGATTKKEFREGILAYREEYKKKFSAIIPNLYFLKSGNNSFASASVSI